MKLYLVRHGHYSVRGPEQQDFLNEQGIAEINRLVNVLRPMNIKVATFFQSGKLRAKQTAELLAPVIKTVHPLQEYSGLQPNEDVKLFYHEMLQWGEDVFIVGHLPFLSRLVSYLVIKNEDKDIVLFQTGTMVCLEGLDLERWIIRWVIHPEILVQAF